MRDSRASCRFEFGEGISGVPFLEVKPPENDPGDPETWSGRNVTTADGGLSPAVRGTGLGAWWRLPDGAFAAVTEAFLFNGGSRTGQQRITQEIEVAPDGQHFDASVTSQIQDINGDVIATGCATSVARRF